MCPAALAPAAITILFAGYLALAAAAGAVLVLRTRPALVGRYGVLDLCALLSESGGRPAAARWAKVDPADRPVLAARRRVSRLAGLLLVAAFAAVWLVLANGR